MQSYMESLISGIDLGEDRLSGPKDKVDESENSNRDKGKKMSNVNSHMILNEKIKYRGYWAKKKNIYLKALKSLSKDSQQYFSGWTKYYRNRMYLVQQKDKTGKESHLIILYPKH